MKSKVPIVVLCIAGFCLIFAWLVAYFIVQNADPEYVQSMVASPDGQYLLTIHNGIQDPGQVSKGDPRDWSFRLINYSDGEMVKTIGHCRGESSDFIKWLDNEKFLLKLKPDKNSKPIEVIASIKGEHMPCKH